MWQIYYDFVIVVVVIVNNIMCCGSGWVLALIQLVFTFPLFFCLCLKQCHWWWCCLFGRCCCFCLAIKEMFERIFPQKQIFVTCSCRLFNILSTNKKLKKFLKSWKKNTTGLIACSYKRDYNRNLGFCWAQPCNHLVLLWIYAL